jgi:hypothetical protein
VPIAYADSNGNGIANTNLHAYADTDVPDRI